MLLSVSILKFCEINMLFNINYLSSVCSLISVCWLCGSQVTLVASPGAVAGKIRRTCETVINWLSDERQNDHRRRRNW